jgi:hypothetical protein
MPDRVTGGRRAIACAADMTSPKNIVNVLSAAACSSPVRVALASETITAP